MPSICDSTSHRVWSKREESDKGYKRILPIVFRDSESGDVSIVSASDLGGQFKLVEFHESKIA